MWPMYCSVVCFMVWLLYGWLINLELLLSPEEQLICFIVGKCFTLSYTMQGFLERKKKKQRTESYKMTILRMFLQCLPTTKFLSSCLFNRGTAERHIHTVAEQDEV